MTNPIIRVHSIETNKVIDREMTVEELTQLEIEQAVQAGQLAAEEQARLDAEAKAAAKAAVLAKLGLTEEEINAFLA